MFLLKNEQYILQFCTLLCALSLSGCMFNDQDAHDFELLMSRNDPQSESQNSHGETDNTGTNDGTTPKRPQEPIHLNETVYTDMCQRIRKCNASYKVVETCVQSYKEYVSTIPECVDVVEDYYQCISGYACKTTGSCKDYVYQFNHQLPSLCAENNNYNQGNYNGCLDYLCEQSKEDFACNDMLQTYEKCVIENCGQNMLQEHVQIVESKIEYKDMAVNCGCDNDDCSKVYFYISDSAAAQKCFRNLKSNAKLYPACIYFEEAYYHCTAKASYKPSDHSFRPDDHSSRNQFVVDYYTNVCKNLNLDKYGYATVDECVAGEIKTITESTKFICEDQQDAYDKCMMSHYGVLPELITVR